MFETLFRFSLVFDVIFFKLPFHNLTLQDDYDYYYFILFLTQKISQAVVRFQAPPGEADWSLDSPVIYIKTKSTGTKGSGA